MQTSYNGFIYSAKISKTSRGILQRVHTKALCVALDASVLLGGDGLYTLDPLLVHYASHIVECVVSKADMN